MVSADGSWESLDGALKLTSADGYGYGTPNWGDYTDPKPFMQGMAGFRSASCAVTFDDFTVRKNES